VEARETLLLGNGYRFGCRSFFAIPFIGICAFAVLFGAAVITRRRPDTHKRLVLLSTAEAVSVAFGRWPVLWTSTAFVVYSVTDAFLAALVVYDITTRRRLHAATVWGGLFLIASQVLRTVIQRNEMWLAFTAWVKG
jgi:hypothetical protein